MKFARLPHCENILYIQFHIQFIIDKILQQCCVRNFFPLSKSIYTVEYIHQQVYIPLSTSIVCLSRAGMKQNVKKNMQI